MTEDQLKHGWGMHSDPAFPRMSMGIDGRYHLQITDGGLTKREWFSGLVMQGLLASLSTEYTHKLIDDVSKKHQTGKAMCLAIRAIELADALIAELEKTNDQNTKT